MSLTHLGFLNIVFIISMNRVTLLEGAQHSFSFLYQI